MTREQFDKAGEYIKLTNHLRSVRERFIECAAMMKDDTLDRHTCLHITDGFGFNSAINQAELLFLIKAYDKEIDRLEDEFRRI